MIDLQEALCLPINLEDARLFFIRAMAVVEPSKRTLEEMKPFLLNGRAEFQKPVIYYMYINVGFRKDVEILKKSSEVRHNRSRKRKDWAGVCENDRSLPSIQTWDKS